MRITPAYAGKTHLLTLYPFGTEDHPRLRGKDRWLVPSMVADRLDHPRLRGKDTKRCWLFFPYQGSPPLTRERQLNLEMYDDAGRITPAYAGKTTYSSPPMIISQDHPRLRGKDN